MAAIVSTCAPPLPSSIANQRHAAIPEEPPTPIWELILEQFKDQLVVILLGSAVVSFVLALFEEEGGWSAFVDPAVVRKPRTGPLTRLPHRDISECRQLCTASTN